MIINLLGKLHLVFIALMISVTPINLPNFIDQIHKSIDVEYSLDENNSDNQKRLDVTDWDSIKEQLQFAQYYFSEIYDATQTNYYASNSDQNLNISLSDTLVLLSSESNKGDLWEFEFGYRENNSSAILETRVKENQITRRFSNRIETIENYPEGIQYKLSIYESSEVLPGLIEFPTNGILKIRSEGNKLIIFSKQDDVLLQIDKLGAKDKRGNSIKANFNTGSNGFSIEVDSVADKNLPITISFLIHQQITKLTSPIPQDGAGFGDSVDISGDFIVVGSWTENNNTGAAYIFHRSEDGEDNWEYVQKLTASDTSTSDFYGHSVSIDGDVIVVGAYGAGTSFAGAAYVYHRRKGGGDQWQEMKRLSAPDSSDFYQFGEEVAISGDIVVVGSYLRLSGTGGVYVFNRSSGGLNNWGYVETLVSSDAEEGDHFGTSIAIDGDVLVIGANFEDSLGSNAGAAYIFQRSHDFTAGWQEISKITGSLITSTSAFGRSVAIKGDTIVVGAPCEWSCYGAVYVYQRSIGPVANWTEIQRITASDPQSNDCFGRSVDISSNTIVAGAYWEDEMGSEAGAAYIFSRNGDQWDQSAKILHSELIEGDNFGSSVAVSGEFFIVGAFAYDNDGPGAAYVYETEDAKFGFISQVNASGVISSDQYGSSVAISDDLLVVGAPHQRVDGVESGAAYVFHRLQDGVNSWGEVEKLIPQDISSDKQFGSSVAISGDVIVIGAHKDDGIDTNAGAVYVFHRRQSAGTQWVQVQKLTASNAVGSDLFGYSVSAIEDVIIVGAHAKNFYAGSVYVFQRSTDGSNEWNEAQILTASDPESYEYFGFSTDIDNDVIIVGAFQENTGGDSAGAAYVFQRNVEGSTSWEQTRKLASSDLSGGDCFGWSVAVDGDVVVVGARNQFSVGEDSGAAYVFLRSNGSADQWGQVKKLMPTGLDPDDNFGYSVAISGDLILVSAIGDESGTGAVYLFNRSVDGFDQWEHMSKFTSSKSEVYNNFGLHIAISGFTFVAATPYMFSSLGGVFLYGPMTNFVYLPLTVR